MRMILAAIFALGVAGTAVADQCYKRVYSDAHLKKNANQSVREMRLRMPSDPEGFASAWVKFRDSSRVYEQSFNCYIVDDPEMPDATRSCSVDCDGGFFFFRPRDDGSVLLTTFGFIVSGGCGEEEETRNVADEGSERTTFKLTKASLSECRR